MTFEDAFLYLLQQQARQVQTLATVQLFLGVLVAIELSKTALSVYRYFTKK